MSQKENVPSLADPTVEILTLELADEHDKLVVSRLQAEAERSKLRSIFAQAPTPMALLEGREHRIGFANALYIEYFLRVEDYVGKPIRELIPRAVDQGLIAILDDVYKTGERHIGKEVLFSVDEPDGTSVKFFINFVYEPVLSSTGEIEGILAVITDVTEIVKARKAEVKAKKLADALSKELAAEKSKMYSLIHESASAIALMRGRDLVFEVANPKWHELVSDRGEYLGRSYADVYPELVGSTAHVSILNSFDDGVRFVAKEMKLKVMSEDGILKDQYFDYTNIQILDSDGTVYGVYCHAVNVTDRVLARLDLEVAKLEAERANQTKSSFLANMSHEIRTPLSAILGFTDLLKERDLPTDERNVFLETIARNGKALTRIIDDILDLAKVESGNLEIERIEFSFFDIIDDVMDIFRERTRSKGIYIRANVAEDTPYRIISDPTRLRQILINIVGNAVKFTHEGGVTIKVKAERQENGQFEVRIIVKDTGIGLTDHQKLRLFQPFMQADNSTTRKFGGTGLGLALSKRLSNALGGTITIEDSSSDRGCAFVVKLLVDVPNTQSPIAAIVETIAAAVVVNLPISGVRILVADDSADNQFLVRRMLVKQGALVELANNGVEAYRMALNGNYDMVLMDIQMPVMDGYEATRNLREAGFKKPIIALTAHAMAEERALTFAAGCNGHLTKPLNQVELVETVLRHIQRTSYHL